MPTRPRSAAISCSAALLLLGCQPDTQQSELTLELLRAPGCELGAVESLELRALGDFPPQREPFDPSASPAVFESFPLDTRELSIEGSFSGSTRAGGRTLVPAAVSDAASTILMLPEGRSCPLADMALI